MEKKYFGTDGIRGKVGGPHINAEFVLKLGWAAGKAFSKRGYSTVIIGKDTRISGYMIESALEAGLSAAGAHVKLLGVIPTPGVAYLTHSLRADAGIVISASHNAYDDNGIKFFDAEGMKVNDELEYEIESYLDSPMQTEVADKLGRAELLVDAQGRYIEFCKSVFPAKLNLKEIRLVVDCAHGATYHIAPKIFHELGAKVFRQGVSPNGFNINKKCGSTDVATLRELVINNNADVGLAFDGDGDRLIMIDHLGEIVDGDELLCIIAFDRLMDIGSRKGVVGTVMSNLGLERALNNYGIAFERAPVGDRYVLDELLKRGWVLGGEASGHIVDLDYTTTGDGIITALQILRIMRMSGKSLHELKQVMIKRPQILINVPISATFELHNFPKVQQALVNVEKSLNGAGRVLLRPSGTEPYVRVMVEGDDEKQVRHVAESLAEIVRQETA